MTNPNKLRAQHGVSLVELLIAVLLTGILTSASFQFYSSMYIQSEAQFDKSEIQNICRVSLSEMKKTLRMAGYKLDAATPPYVINGDSLKIYYNGEMYSSDGGLMDLIEEETEEESIYTPLHFRDKTLDLALTHTGRYNEHYFSFVNGQFTNDGGTHLSAFREGILKAVNDFTRKRYDGDDVREGCVKGPQELRELHDTHVRCERAA